MDDRGNRHGDDKHGPTHRPPGAAGHGHGPEHGQGQGHGRVHGHGHGHAHGPGRGHGAGHGPAARHGRGPDPGQGPGTGPGAGKGRGAPPETTGAETNYIIKNMQAKTPMVVRLANNEEVRGWIEYYDNNVIKLNRQVPPHLLIRKENIKYMYKDEDAAPASPRDRS